MRANRRLKGAAPYSANGSKRHPRKQERSSIERPRLRDGRPSACLGCLQVVRRPDRTRSDVRRRSAANDHDPSAQFDLRLPTWQHDGDRDQRADGRGWSDARDLRGAHGRYV